MTFDNLIRELRKLSRSEKLQAMQVLVADLAEEDLQLNPNTVYELHTPYGNHEAAAVLYDVLQQHEADS